VNAPAAEGETEGEVDGSLRRERTRLAVRIRVMVVRIGYVWVQCGSQRMERGEKNRERFILSLTARHFPRIPAMETKKPAYPGGY